MLFSISLASLLAAPVTPLVSEDEWPRFRGPNGTGLSGGATAPVEFGSAESLQWSASVPYGSSSPVVTRDAVYVTGADEEGLAVVCVERESGEVRWQHRIERANPTEVYPANDSASPSPVTDGENVYAFFPEFGLVSCDAAGEERWRLELEPFVSFYGMAASPVLVGDAIVLLADQQQGSYMIAVDKDSGEPRWRTTRAGQIESWATPVVYPVEAPTQVIAFGSFSVCGYSLETGEELWRVPGLGYAPVCSPVLDGERLYVCTPYHGELPLPSFEVLLGSDANENGVIESEEAQGEMADHFGWADANKDGHIDREEWEFCLEGMNTRDYGLVAFDLAPLAEDGEARELWRYKRGLPSIASPIVVGELIYTIRDGGVLTGLDTNSGEAVVRKRVDGLDGEVWASPIATADRLYLASNGGRVVVQGVGAEGATLAVNELDAELVGTPALAGGALYVRTRDGLRSYRGPAE